MHTILCMTGWDGMKRVIVRNARKRRYAVMARRRHDHEEVVDI